MTDQAAEAVADQPTDLQTNQRPLAERARQPVLKFLTLAWVPLSASLLSLILSVTAIWVSTQQPEVLLVMPDQIRIAQGRNFGSAFVYLQPAFVSTGKNDRAEVIRDMTLHVTPATGAAADFMWTEEIELVGDTSTNGLSYRHVGDAAPLMVNARTSAAPLALFDAPDGWYFGAGTYTFTLTAERIVTGQPLTANFTVTVSPENLAFLEEPGTSRFLTFPISQ